MNPILIEDIPSEGLELREEERPDSLGLKDDKIISYIGTIAVWLKMEKVKERVTAKGGVSFKARLVCVKCLEPFLKNIKYPLDIVYEPESLKVIKKEGFLNEEQVDVFYYGKKGIIEVADAIREYVLLSLPIKPICMSDCLGLCPSCGKNLNQDMCLCQREKPDPIFKKLKGLKFQEKK